MQRVCSRFEALRARLPWARDWDTPNQRVCTKYELLVRYRVASLVYPQLVAAKPLLFLLDELINHNWHGKLKLYPAIWSYRTAATIDLHVERLRVVVTTHPDDPGACKEQDLGSLESVDSSIDNRRTIRTKQRPPSSASFRVELSLAPLALENATPQQPLFSKMAALGHQGGIPFLNLKQIDLRMT